MNVGGKGSRASSNSITGTLSLGFWGSATGNVIITQKAMAISATVPRAQIVGNITMDEFYVVPLTASGTSATFDGTDADNFNIGDSVTFQSSKNIETRMISGKSGNMITWDAALNSTYDGEKAFTCLAHLEGLSSLSVTSCVSFPRSSCGAGVSWNLKKSWNRPRHGAPITRSRHREGVNNEWKTI